MSGTAQRADAFHLEIDGISAGSFVRCSGLGARTEIFPVREGGREHVSYLRGCVAYSPLVLECGVLRDPGLLEWFLRGERRDGAVVLLGADGREVLRWAFRGGWPCRWEGPELDARQPEIALERLEIAHEGLQCVTS
jgi:phage tail-like protein